MEIKSTYSFQRGRSADHLSLWALLIVGFFGIIAGFLFLLFRALESRIFDWFAGLFFIGGGGRLLWHSLNGLRALWRLSHVSLENDCLTVFWRNGKSTAFRLPDSVRQIERNDNDIRMTLRSGCYVLGLRTAWFSDGDKFAESVRSVLSRSHAAGPSKEAGMRVHISHLNK